MERFSQEIEERQFSSSRRGYDRDEVEQFMKEGAHRVTALEDDLRAAEVSAANSEMELASLQANIDSVLQEATDARRKIIEEAKSEAAVIVGAASPLPQTSVLTDAAARAAAIISQAENEATILLERGKTERKLAETKMEAKSEKMEADAARTKAEADRLLDNARMDANIMRADAQSRKTELEVQLAEIQSLLAEAHVTTLRSSGGVDEPDTVIDLRDGATIDRTSSGVS